MSAINTKTYNTTSYNLYGSEGCHLCEQAQAICEAVIAPSQINYIDIIEQESVAHEKSSLVELYGVHIPVLEKLELDSKNNIQLFWPFTQEQVMQLEQN
jgi:hypothetical protein